VTHPAIPPEIRICSARVNKKQTCPYFGNLSQTLIVSWPAKVTSLTVNHQNILDTASIEEYLAETFDHPPTFSVNV
jgi:hypothetical protein